MPSKIVNELKEEIKSMKKDLMAHLIESGGIKARLDVNTWLTGVILIGLLALWFKN